MSNLELTYFDYAEFDSPDEPGSGKKYMDEEFLMKLDVARSIANTPFKITSGYRSEAHTEILKNKGYKVAKNSAHRHGHAVDIACTDSIKRYKIINALITVGLNRIGIGKTFIHTDNMKTGGKTPNVIWTYY